jgi:hypothetical protein
MVIAVEAKTTAPVRQAFQRILLFAGLLAEASGEQGGAWRDPESSCRGHKNADTFLCGAGSTSAPARINFGSAARKRAGSAHRR